MFSSNQRFSTFFLKADAAPELPHGQKELGPCLGETDPLSPHIPHHSPTSTGKDSVQRNEGSACARGFWAEDRPASLALLAQPPALEAWTLCPPQHP